MQRKTFLLLVLLACLCICHKEAMSAPFKKLTLQGTIIFEEQKVIEGAGLTRLLKKEREPSSVARAIRMFYRSRGYDLVTAYIVHDTPHALVIFIDEGRLGKIVFLNINTLDFIRIRYEFRLEGKIFNRYHVKRELAALEKKYRFKHVSYRLREIKNYDRSFFQIDRDLNIPVIISQFIPYLETYAPRYIMEVMIDKGRKGTPSNYGFKIGIKANRGSGFMPQIRYHHNSLIGRGDSLKTKFTTGVMYGLNFKFDTPPEVNWFDFEGKYRFPPLLKKIFTPVTGFKIYHSNQERIDIDLAQFRYTRYRVTAAPGITLLKKLLISAGFGYEYINHYTSIPKENAPVPPGIPSSEHYFIINTEISLETIPFFKWKTTHKSFTINYDAYMDHVTFHRIRITGLAGFALSRQDQLSLKLNYSLNEGSVPLVYEYRVSNDFFKGFQGRGYYSNRTGAVSLEYSFSIYRDFIYTGLFGEATIFRATGRDLSGLNGGIIGGISFRLLLFDQFESVIYLGQDWLVATDKTQFNGYFSLTKKW